MDPSSRPPSPPRLKTTGLPEYEEGDENIPNMDLDITLPTFVDETTAINDLTPSQIHDLNQGVMNASVLARPLIGPIAPMSELREEYENGSPSFVQQIDWLYKQGYQSVHRTRGDGDCFYRSAAFAYVERLMQESDPQMAGTQALSLLESTLPMLEKVGFQSLVYEDFYDCLADLIRRVIQPDAVGDTLTHDELLRAFQLAEVSNSIVVYLRLVTSAQIRLDPDDFNDVLFHPETGQHMEPRQFCESFVEASGKEADHVQMIALCRALHLNIDVAYLDGRGPDGSVNFVPFRCAADKEAKPLTLLYRPGHYDILVKLG